MIPSTHAPVLERELYMATLMADVADKLAEVGERLDALDRRVAALEAKPKRRAPAKPKAAK